MHIHVQIYTDIAHRFIYLDIYKYIKRPTVKFASHSTRHANLT